MLSNVADSCVYVNAHFGCHDVSVQMCKDIFDGMEEFVCSVSTVLFVLEFEFVVLRCG